MAHAGQVSVTAQQVVERQKFLEQVIKFAIDIVQERGTQLECSVHPWHTHTVAELNDFEGFSFHHDSGHTMYGGDDLDVWYHPNGNKKGPDTLVLRVYWQTIDQCRVRRFDSSSRWQRQLLSLAKDKAAAIERDKRKKEKGATAQQKADAAAKALRDAEARLSSEATRLGLAI